MDGRASSTDYGAAALGLGITRRLATFLAEFDAATLPAAVIAEARRGVLDWLGCALAGSRHRNVAALLGVMRASGHDGPALVLGHGCSLGLLEAPVVNGTMGHVLDFDDTHMGGVVLHASSPILAACFALAGRGGVSGRALIAAYAAGFEAGVRSGQAAPAHHDGGWHLTGTLGSIAAGAAAARLLGLDARQMVHALGIAATQAAGMQQNRGTACKSLHAGKAAANGVLAGLLAEAGLDSSDEILEGKRGFCRIYSATTAPHAVLHELGERWEITRNGYKPYACGVVLHPAIDAVRALRAQAPMMPDAVERIELAVNPAAVRITGVVDPQNGLKAKFSIGHSAAVAYVDGEAGIAQYGDARATAPEIVALRQRVVVTTDEALRRDEARALLVLRDGRELRSHVPHATGTVDNPMSDAAIEAKFLANATPVIGAARAAEVVARVAALDGMADVRALLEPCA